jgi:aspartate/glutamate racemase
MPSKNSKIQTRPIEDLIGRIRTLRQKGERQIVIPAKEADQLADSLSQVMTRMVTIQEEIIEALKTAKEAQTINIEMDGGGFSTSDEE